MRLLLLVLLLSLSLSLVFGMEEDLNDNGKREYISIVEKLGKAVAGTKLNQKFKTALKITNNKSLAELKLELEQKEQPEPKAALQENLVPPNPQNPPNPPNLPNPQPALSVAKELGKLACASILLFISALTAAEVFPDHPSDFQEWIDTLIAPKIYKEVLYVFSQYYSGWIFIFLAAICMAFPKAAKLASGFRKAMCALSVALIAISLTDLISDYIRSLFPHLSKGILFYEKWIERALFVFALIISFWKMSFESCATIALVGNAWILHHLHFYDTNFQERWDEFWAESNFRRRAEYLLLENKGSSANDK